MAVDLQLKRICTSVHFVSEGHSFCCRVAHLQSLTEPHWMHVRIDKMQVLPLCDVSKDNSTMHFDFVRVAPSLMSLLPTFSERRTHRCEEKWLPPLPSLPFFFHFSSHFLLWIRGCRLIGVSVVPSETGADYFGPSSVWFDGHWWRLSSL